MLGSGVSEEEHRLGREGKKQNSLWKGHRWSELLVVESEVERKNVGFGKRSELLGEKKGILSIMKIRMSGKKMGLNLRSRNVSLRQSGQSFQ